MDLDGGGTADGPVQAAMDRLASAVDGLVAAVEGGGLERLDALGLVELLQSVERVRNRMPLVDHAVLTACVEWGVAQALAQPSLSRVLVSVLRLSSGEASRRVRAAEALAPRVTMTGEALEPRRPVLAAAQRAGEVTPEQVHLIERALERVDRPGDPADVAAGEALLVGQAAVFEPKVLGRLAGLVVDGIDPDGRLPDEQLSRDRRHFCLRATRDGGYVGEVRLTRVLGTKLSAVLRPLARPRTETIPLPDGDALLPPTLSSSDERTHGQRMHDALEDVCDRLLRSGGLPDSGGTPATVIVTITVEDLLDGLGSGVTSNGVTLSTGDILRLAGQADLIPTVINRAGAVLTQGRARRIATPAQTWALVARDGGCSFPGCDRPPELCERHHILPWVQGGLTDLDNLTQLCPYHHRQFADRGWTVALNRDRLPEWTPPSWIDREQRPLLSTRIQLNQLTRQKATSRAGPARLHQPELVPA